MLRYLIQIGHHYLGGDSFFGQIDEAINAFGNTMLNPREYGINVREYGIGVVSLGIVAVLLLLMMTGMPLGIVTSVRATLTSL